MTEHLRIGGADSGADVVHIHPAPLSLAERQRRECSREQLADIAELNKGTVESQAEEMRRLAGENARLERELASARETRLLAVRRVAELDSILSGMQEEIVFVCGRWISLYSAHEDGLFRTMCPNGCKDVQCEGCVVRDDQSLTAEVEAHEIDVWRSRGRRGSSRDERRRQRTTECHAVVRQRLRQNGKPATERLLPFVLGRWLALVRLRGAVNARRARQEGRGVRQAAFGRASTARRVESRSRRNDWKVRARTRRH